MVHDKVTYSCRTTKTSIVHSTVQVSDTVSYKSPPHRNAYISYHNQIECKSQEAHQETDIHIYIYIYIYTYVTHDDQPYIGSHVSIIYMLAKKNGPPSTNKGSSNVSHNNYIMLFAPFLNPPTLLLPHPFYQHVAHAEFKCGRNIEKNTWYIVKVGTLPYSSLEPYFFVLIQSFTFIIVGYRLQVLLP